MAANPKIKDWRGRRVWLLGASCGIGAALAEALAAHGAHLTLSARTTEALQHWQAGEGGLSSTRIVPLDVTDLAALDAVFARMDEGAEPLPDIGIYLAGDYTALDATGGEAVLPAARRMLAVNYSGAVEWSQRFAQRLLKLPSKNADTPRGMALVSSVAAYAGLPKALAYSPSKAALLRYAECLYFDLAARGLGVWAINPGFVATRLTAQNDFKMPALISAEKAAQEILDGFASGQFEIHFPKRFTRLMKLISVLPYALSLPIIGRSKTP